MILKSDTSLSKAYDFIHRFSENLDISLDRTHLGFKSMILNVRVYLERSESNFRREHPDLRFSSPNNRWLESNSVRPLLSRACSPRPNQGFHFQDLAASGLRQLESDKVIGSCIDPSELTSAVVLEKRP